MSALAGVLIVDKPTGMTSHDVVNRVRRCLKTRRVGHAGTLDPDASGVLVLCVGEATRLLEYLTADDKTYEGTVTFGIATDTDDATGQVIRCVDASGLTLEDVLGAAASLTGQYRQRVPAYSAVHINGKRAYELARTGQDILCDLPERDVTVVMLDVLNFFPGEAASADFRVSCSKGTYIRSLCRDWGERVHHCAHMSTLRRTKSGPFSQDTAVTLDQLAASSDPVALLMPMEKAVSHLPSIRMDMTSLVRLGHGQTLSLPSRVTSEPGVYAVLHEDGRLWMMAEMGLDDDGHRTLRPRKVFVSPTDSQ